MGLGESECLCEENLRILHRVFAKHEVPFWLENCTSLGVVREGGIIPYDVTFLGKTFWVPPDDYMVYGHCKNWRTHDWRRDCKKSLAGKTTCVDTAPPSSPA